MSNYKDTLNLPQTPFPMKANLAQREPQTLAHWQAMDLYRQTRHQAKGKPQFILHHGPPYANGAIHLGHALNMALKDFVVKSKLLSGYDAPLVPGWDCHGLPIELNVEKKKGRAGQKISPRDFRLACREYADKQIALQKIAFERLGVLADWQQPYLTMSYQYEADTIRALSVMVQKGHLQSGFKPVHWCLDCASALAEAEVEYKDKTSTQIDVRFVLVEPEALFYNIGAKSDKARVSIPIWTTTPWTLPANEAVCVHAELDYVLVEFNDEALIVAEDLLSHVMQRYGIDHYEVVHRFKGQTLENVQAHHPLYEKIVPIILGEHVTTEAGTGAVHTAPGHGEDDYRVGLQYGLSVNNPVNENGVYYDDTPLLGGQHILKANAMIVDLLREKGVLLHEDKLTHSYPHCWRHKSALLFRATPQWFISMEKKGLRADALKAIKGVRWLPESGEKRITSMIDGRPDWCISRQRTWGVPIAVFAHKQTGELHPNTAELMERAAKLVEKSGVQAWYDIDVNEWLGCDAEHYEAVQDILDVWFDSGSSHFAVLDRRDELRRPADLYLEGSDQHRGWFQTSLLTSCAMHGEAPYKAVLTHGFTVDAQGHKMSKSQGNGIDPQDVFKQLGADVLRLWVASTDFRFDMAVSHEILNRTSDSYRRLRNTARFLLSNLHDFDPAQSVHEKDMVELDRWLLQKTRETQAEIIEAYDSYQFHRVQKALMQFCSIDLGSFYLDIIKDRQYTGKTEGLPRRSAQTAMYHALEALVRWLAPVLSFTAEEIWQYIPGERTTSVFLSEWYADIPASHEVDMTEWVLIKTVRDRVNKAIEQARADGVVGSSLEAKVTIVADNTVFKQLSRIQDELRFVLITSGCELKKAAGESLEEGVSITVEACAEKKCERCWHRTEDVGFSEAYVDICLRCVSNIAGEGEVRHYA
ncbi:MAG: isoleucine--tRNA ligase [Gammaproteobacteria bacterium CG11_big_fil_rev_8_21_14_0_20_46_22]|nr:MAG: isoleucine--tRNA ligase [Gammaproteobacteria bacterium CG12_big_fil_rev_8_21_14_0_65_46_12]PIR11908.1 MAG: isoleucine--tRNA ligase [Gammaproteobacteria bacterium CG11_big_fil_rev_8_21_14_0_20_46_22]